MHIFIIYSNQKVGDDYVKALSKGLRYSDHISSIELSANRLTFYGVNPLIKSIETNTDLLKRLRNLDLSFNKIGSQSVRKIMDYCKNEDCELEELNLEGNNLGDHVIVDLSNTLNCYLHEKVTLLNFGRNCLTDEACGPIANLLGNCFSLQTLMLQWNQIHNYGASVIVSRAKRHSGLRILDLSWNSIGNSLSNEPVMFEESKMTKTDRGPNSSSSSSSNSSSNFNFFTNTFRKTMQLNFKKPGVVTSNQNTSSQNSNGGNITQVMTSIANNNNNNNNTNTILNKNISAFAKELGEYFKDSSIGLVHLDISHNNIGYEDCVHLCVEVKHNHTILGLHVDGNEMCTDELGFMQVIKKQTKECDYFANSQIYYGIAKQTNIIKTSISKVRKIRAKNNCWICEGWKEVPFSYSPEPDVNSALLTVKLHLNFENWKPFDMHFTKGKFSCTRMCPPGPVLFFFSVDKCPVENYGTTTFDLSDPVIYEFDTEYNQELSNMHAMNMYNITQSPQKEDNDLELLNRTYDSLTNVDRVTIRKVGKVISEVNCMVIDDFCRNLLKYCVPRPERKRNNFVKPRTPWTYDISIWAGHGYRFEGESEMYLDEVFDHDFNRCRMQKDAKTDEVHLEVKNMLRQHYRKM